RNRLAAIVTGVTPLTRSKVLGERQAGVAARMLRSAQRMGRMIDELLDLTRTRFGDPIPVARATMELGPLCRQVTAELEGLRLFVARQVVLAHGGTLDVTSTAAEGRRSPRASRAMPSPP
nr:hypothetical protein [Deltaproteobacteria bacterium]